MRKTAIALLGGLGCFSSVAAADVVGVGAQVSYWDSDLTGTASQNSDVVDVDDDLNLDRDDNVNLTAIFEHPIPVLPNVRVNYTAIKQSGNGQLGVDGYGGLAPDVPVHSELDLDQLDLTLYYELLDNWVNLDAGLTVRKLDGDLQVEERVPGGNRTRTEIDAVLPMLYAAARFDLPLTGLSVGVEGNGISYGGDSLLDGSAYAQYDLSVLRLQAGYRKMSIDYEDGNDAMDVDLGGPFISAGLDF
ncbi:TIGR04219 family outer membrane beta-barrel protein [Marinobacter halodurans]|uniref:TIGR04219 family outer membrane beta-barrel protein n=1 Tax=Marinobacter halodurans TaxID=2528979 RepID=A0ABY1ZE49_9GAMM|nr:TIGR04219 family outer membrane beta-barrel protein [Marinobacter halodurans]TBW47580.1 TIGR04219 family outer membrane beta-barrel protein [Marinobacter halodurans]